MVMPLGRLFVVVLVLLGEWTGLAVAPAVAQPESAALPPARDLKGRIEERFQILPLRNGVLLTPRANQPVRSIEVSDGRVAIDGVEATGGELRARLGADADMILQLSYLEPAAQRALLGEAPTAGPSVPLPSPPIEPRVRREPRRGSSVRFGSDVTVGVDEVVADDVVVFGGSADILGRVNGDVVVIGGSIDLGPSSDVQGNVVVFGGRLNRAPGAGVGGDVVEMGAGQAFRRRFGSDGLPRRWWPFGSPAVSFAGTSLRMGVLMLIGCLVMLVARGPVERIGARAAAEPVKAGLVGLLAEILVLPVLIVTVVVLAISIVGIPLLVLVPFAILALVLVFLLGFTSVAARLGRSAAAKLGWSWDRPYLATALGVLILLSPLLLARVLDLAAGGAPVFTFAFVALGLLLEHVAWTVGLGASALARFGPPLPALGSPTLSPDSRPPTPEPRAPNPESHAPDPESPVPNPESRLPNPESDHA